MTPEIEKTEKPGAQAAPATKDRPTYRRPRLVEVGTLRDVRAKGGRDGDHDTGYYFGRSRQ